jgi:tetratricopeptide (TPR) repeat protein
MGLFGKDKTTKLWEQALDFGDVGNWKECIRCYDQIIEINSNDSLAWRGKGVTLNVQEKYDEAIICFDKALEINPYDDISLGAKKDSLTNKEQIKIYESEDKIFELKKKGLGLIIEFRYEDALVCFDEILRTNPNDAASWSSKGDALTEIDRVEEGLQCYDKSLEIDPDDGNTWLQKGMQLSLLERYDEATVCIDKSLEIDPDNQLTIIAKQNLDTNKIKVIMDLGVEGKELYELKKYDEAMQCFKKIVKVDYLDADQKDAFENMIKLCLSKLNKSQNEKTPEPQAYSSDDDPLKILKIRLAKGEITLEEFNKIKDNLE